MPVRESQRVSSFWTCSLTKKINSLIDCFNVVQIRFSPLADRSLWIDFRSSIRKFPSLSNLFLTATVTSA